MGFLILALFLGIKFKILLLTVGLYYHKLIVKTSRKYSSSLDIFTFLHDQVCSTCLIKFHGVFKVLSQDSFGKIYVRCS